MFHTLHGGANPVDLITRYASRVTSLHLKDLKRVSPSRRHRDGDTDADVRSGGRSTGLPSLRRDEGRRFAHYVEDESAVLGHIPQSRTWGI